MELNKRCIDSGYVVAADANDDTRIYTKKDPFVYYSQPDDKWGNLSVTTVASDEKALAALLEKANESPETKKYGYVPFPVYVETLITSVDSESFNTCRLEIKRQKALDKLSEEDIAVLGLDGKS